MKIEFTYGDDLEVRSCVDTDTGKRLPRTAAAIFFKLWHGARERPVHKDSVAIFVWGRTDHHVRRSFDVHLHHVRKFLKGTGHYVDTSKHDMVCLRDIGPES